MALAWVFFTVSISAIAADQVKGFYVGVGYGIININSEEGERFSRANNGSLNFGYSFSENWAVEALFSQTISGGAATIKRSLDVTQNIRADALSQGLTPDQAEEAVVSAKLDTSAKAKATIDNYGLFGVYRTSGPLYGKFKVGVLNVRTSLDTTPDEGRLDVTSIYSTKSYSFSDSAVEDLNFYIDSSKSETKFSYGAGGGYKISEKFAVEVEFTRLLNDYNSYSLTAIYQF